jgi:hypothetical protein
MTINERRKNENKQKSFSSEIFWHTCADITERINIFLLFVFWQGLGGRFFDWVLVQEIGSFCPLGFLRVFPRVSLSLEKLCNNQLSQILDFSEISKITQN